MQIKFILIVIIILPSAIINGQKTKLNFYSAVQAGILEGEEGSSFQLQSINGIKYKTWATGIGVGLDYYHTRSIPLFLDIRKSIFNSSKSPFVYASGGYHFPWSTTKDKFGYANLDSKAGIYYDAGIGYRLPVLKNNSLFFSAGYSLKRFSQEVSYYTYCLTGNCPEYRQRFDYSFRRISIRTGLQF
jgi:hypothetical protein